MFKQVGGEWKRASLFERDPNPGDSDDPITQNGYVYANDNPVMGIDLSLIYFKVSILNSSSNFLTLANRHTSL